MQDTIRTLIQKNSSKIFMFVLDGLGGLPVRGSTELEAAKTRSEEHTSELQSH